MALPQTPSALDDFLGLGAASLNAADRQGIIMGGEWQPLPRDWEAAEVTEESAELPVYLGHSI